VRLILRITQKKTFPNKRGCFIGETGSNFAIDSECNVYLCYGVLYKGPCLKFDETFSDENRTLLKKQVSFDFPDRCYSCVALRLCGGCCVLNVNNDYVYQSVCYVRQQLYPYLYQIYDSDDKWRSYRGYRVGENRFFKKQTMNQNSINLLLWYQFHLGVVEILLRIVSLIVGNSK
jgi:radical SAM protein with 4Fe4S-binding SPASM domain